MEWVLLLAIKSFTVPFNDLQQHSLRLPAPPEEFERLSVILTNPSETLLEDRVLRKDQLMAQIKDGQVTF